MSAPIDFRSVAEKSLARYPSANFYLLLDQSGLPGLRRRLRNNSVAWASLFDSTIDAAASKNAPLLVCAAGNGRLSLPRPVFEWIGENGTFTSTVIMLSSELSMVSMKDRLAMRLTVLLSEKQEAMLRFFDPRVLESLISVLSGDQAADFFGVADMWSYVNRHGKVVDIETAFNPDESSACILTLEQHQEFMLLECCEIDQVMHLLRSNVPELLKNLPRSKQYEFVEKQIEVAREKGLESTAHLTIYSAAILSKGESFSKSPECIDLIGRLGR